MLKKNKVLTREYMQDYKSKRDKNIPSMEKKIKKLLVRRINKKIKIRIKYGENVLLLKLSKDNVLDNSQQPFLFPPLSSKVDDNRYKRILLEVFSEYEKNGIKVSETTHTRYTDEFIFDLRGVFDNDN